MKGENDEFDKMS